MTTAVVSLTSDLKRKKWMREGLIQASSKSFWNAYQGSSKDSIVFQQNNASAAEGHTVVFDFDGNLSGKAIKGKDTAYGKGEQKRKFSDKITVERYRLVVDNGDEFDGVDIGDLATTQHADSRAKLGDLFVRFKDQMLFDAAQGLVGQAPTHVIDLGTAFTYANLLTISNTLKTSQGFTTGGIRRPLDPFRLADGEAVWLFIIDSAMKTMLLQDATAVAGFAAVMGAADIRGNNNRMISQVLGKIGNLLIVEAPNFFGSTTGSTPGWGFEDSNIEISGLRQYSSATATTSPWTGQATFNYSSGTVHSRGLIMGAGALQIGFGKMPDYKFQSSQDFAIKSESAVEFWVNSQKCKLTAEHTDFTQAKVAAIDYGVICVDVEVT
jgi:hypothetical protein